MVETVETRQVMWIVILESAKDQVLRVDTLGQQMPSWVWYGTALLLIRDDVGSVPCSNVWELA
jgi:hypothetical protein